jgi:hypothetical protein
MMRNEFQLSLLIKKAAKAARLIVACTNAPWPRMALTSTASFLKGYRAICLDPRQLSILDTALSNLKGRVGLSALFSILHF